MPFILKTLSSITAYAKFNNVIVEKTGNKYHCWNKNDSSVVAESDNLKDLLNDVDDLASK